MIIISRLCTATAIKAPDEINCRVAFLQGGRKIIVRCCSNIGNC